MVHKDHRGQSVLLELEEQSVSVALTFLELKVKVLPQLPIALPLGPAFFQNFLNPPSQSPLLTIMCLCLRSLVLDTLNKLNDSYSNDS